MSDYDLGNPDELFYWGPSRALPLYMSDFMAAAEQFFITMSKDAELPNPPPSLVLFHDGKMVWLSNQKAFNHFTLQTFLSYEKANRINDDIAHWEQARDKAPITTAWQHTLYAEFALYGAETAVGQRLSRFDDVTRHKIWATFTTPDNGTFLTRLDDRLRISKDATAMAKQYPWIEDGYDGVHDSALKYFEKHLSTIGEARMVAPLKAQRDTLAQELELTDKELVSLDLIRQLATFMDERKAWMMQTRRHIIKPFSPITNGWFFADGKANLLDEDQTTKLWQYYVDFKSSPQDLKGMVASNGGKKLIQGEVVIVTSPTDSIDVGKIMVVPSTSPSYVPLMRSAKALITDHGGIMSHAAIVAREFGLPCIVGTGHATKILKSGDKVTMNLESGEIKS